eukprot:135413_1
MFRLMSGLLKNEFEISSNNWVFPPRRRDNICCDDDTVLNENLYNLLRSPQTPPISICCERKTWYKKEKNENDLMRQMIINFQKEFCTAWVEVLEQYRLFWVNIAEAQHHDIRVKAGKRIQKYAHPRYRAFLTQIQQTRMFSSFQCIRSLANNAMLASPMFDNLVMRSLRFRQSLYHDIIRQQKQERGRMKVSLVTARKEATSFMNHDCSVRFDPNDCTLYVQPDSNKLAPFEVKLQATIYELVMRNSDVAQVHPYCDRKQVHHFGPRYQFKIIHKNDGQITFNCQNYYQLTRWIHILRTHSMDTWSWSLKNM